MHPSIHPGRTAQSHPEYHCLRLVRVADPKQIEMGKGKVINDAVKNFEVTGIDHHLLVDADFEEEFSDSFRCCVCLDLLYKPIVLTCGHISCFWCVNKSMSGLRESNCPICRHPYNHFPTVCQMLHFLLFKLYPTVYMRREKQTLGRDGNGPLLSTIWL
uniref:RING-type domain-containing protein n=1 Tax=Salix viminalis TaxID=40686 RepID=A0A6N2MY32_SALVM